MAINWVYIVLVLVLSVGSIILHELAHGIVAYWLGDQTAKLSGRLTLNPIKHIDPFMSILLPVLLALAGMPVFGGAKPVPINTRNLKGGVWGFALVAIAGPLTNLILAFIFFLIGHFSGAFGALDSFGFLICYSGLMLNLGFCLFNLIPIPPLDGFHILERLLPVKVTYSDGFRKFVQYGPMGLMILILLGNFGNIDILGTIMYYIEFPAMLIINIIAGLIGVV
jgi:Zn-dependent protease